MDRRKIQITAKAALSQVWRLACLHLSGAALTDPTAVLEKILQPLPIFLILQEAARLTLIRMQTGVNRRNIIATKGFLLKNFVTVA